MVVVEVSIAFTGFLTDREPWLTISQLCGNSQLLDQFRTDTSNQVPLEEVMLRTVCVSARMFLCTVCV